MEAVIKTQAACYTSQEAKELGLIDNVLTVEQAVDLLTKKDFEMSKEQDKVVEQTATATETQVDAATAERQRIQAIMGCEAAQEQPKLAAYFAFQTNTSAEASVAALEAAKADKAVQPKAEAPQTYEPNYLAEAMAQNGSPNVGADNGKEYEAEQQALLKAAADFANSFSY